MPFFLVRRDLSVWFVLAAVVQALYLLGCSRGDRPVHPGPPALFSQQLRSFETGSLEIGTSLSSGGDDRVFIRSIAFENQVTFEPFVLDGSYEIEYLPMVDAESGHALSFEMVIRDQRGREFVLNTNAPLASRHPSLKGDRRAECAFDVVNVDLSPWEGQKISLSWRLVDLRVEPGSNDKPQNSVAHLGRLTMRRLAGDLRRPPDILMVCSDTHRYDYAVSTDGRSLMPHTEKFANSAVRFEQAISASSWTLPSVASVLTGLNPRSHLTGRSLESGRTADWEPGRQLEPGRFKMGWGDSYHVISAFPAEIETVAERLGRLGYTTVAVSANGLLRLSGLGQDGVDFFHSVGQSRADRVKEIVEKIAFELHDRGPLFLYIQLIDVHEYQHLGLHEVPEDIKLAGAAEVQRYRYRNEVANVDHFVGNLINWWNGGVGRDESMVAFFSDHGEHLRDSGGPNHGHGISMHDVLLHVPLIVRFPESENVTPGAVDTTVSLVDLTATVLDLAGDKSAIDELPGRTLIELARGEISEDRIVFADFQLMGDQKSAIQSGRYKLVKNFSRGTSVLYDMMMASDHGEPAKVIEDLAIERRLEEAFVQYVLDAERNTSGLSSQKSVDPVDAEQQLKALGYLE